MNIFVLDTDLTTVAQMHCDKHVPKMTTHYSDKKVMKNEHLRT